MPLPHFNCLCTRRQARRELERGGRWVGAAELLHQSQAGWQLPRLGRAAQTCDGGHPIQQCSSTTYHPAASARRKQALRCAPAGAQPGCWSARCCRCGGSDAVQLTKVLSSACRGLRPSSLSSSPTHPFALVLTLGLPAASESAAPWELASSCLQGLAGSRPGASLALHAALLVIPRRTLEAAGQIMQPTRPSRRAAWNPGWWGCGQLCQPWLRRCQPQWFPAISLLCPGELPRHSPPLALSPSSQTPRAHCSAPGASPADPPRVRPGASCAG